ncbi:hypothetical protein [Reyranella sp.]|uniref:hypothetical protein n=1 Tax=Reyranella sp. TaxID=1929291 RepID=UPI003D105A1E
MIQINGLSPGLGKNERKTGNLEHAMPLGCAIVWMDSKEAHVYRFSIDDVEQERIKARSPFRHIQHRAGMIGAGKEYLDRDYFDHIINALRGVREWLLVGPGNAHDGLLAHLDAYVPWLKAQMVGVARMDYPTDGDLVDRARRVFERADDLQPSSPAPLV